jgi:hypothetical protein
MTDADKTYVWAAFQTAIADLTTARASSADLLGKLQTPLNGDLGKRGEPAFSPLCLNLHTAAADSVRRLADQLSRGELASDETIASVKQSLVNYFPASITRAADLDNQLKAISTLLPPALTPAQMTAANDALLAKVNEVLGADYAALDALTKLTQTSELFAVFSHPVLADQPPRLMAEHWVGIALGAVLVILVSWFLWFIRDGGSLQSLSSVDVARGLLTLLVGAGTVFLGLIIVVAMWLGDGDAESDRKFLRSKEVFGLLLTVLATVMGFYYGAEKTAIRELPMELAPVAVRDQQSLKVATSISGGKAPYSYSIPDLQITNSLADGRRIEHTFTNFFTNSTISTTFKIVVTDSNSNHVSEAVNIPPK